MQTDDRADWFARGRTMMQTTILADDEPDGTDDETWWSSPEACMASGATYRQLDYWTRIGAIVPTTAALGSGSRRRWSTADVHRLTMCVRVIATVGLAGGEPVGVIWTTLSQDGLLESFRVTDRETFYVWPLSDDPEADRRFASPWGFGRSLPVDVDVATVIRTGWPDPLEALSEGLT